MKNPAYTITAARMKLQNGEAFTAEQLEELADAVRGSSNANNRTVYVAAKNSTQEAKDAQAQREADAAAAHAANGTTEEKEKTQPEPPEAEDLQKAKDAVTAAGNKARTSGHMADKLAFVDAKAVYAGLREFADDMEAQAAAQAAAEGGGTE